MTARLSQRERAYREVRENDWQDTVIDALHWRGWKVAHFRPAQVGGRWVTAVQGDGVGFPDLIAVHPLSGDRLVAELKRETEKATPAQLQWLAWFETAGIDAYVWRPSDVDAMHTRIARHDHDRSH